MKTFFKNTRSSSSFPEVTVKRNICGKKRRHDDSGASSAWGMVNYKQDLSKKKMNSQCMIMLKN